MLPAGDANLSNLMTARARKMMRGMGYCMTMLCMLLAEISGIGIGGMLVIYAGMSLRSDVVAGAVYHYSDTYKERYDADR